MLTTITTVTVLGASLLMTWLVRLYALRHAVLDVPNERSSHTSATPRGGGLAIVVTVLAAAAWLHASGLIEAPLAYSLLIGGAAVAALGWIDDHRRLGVGLRVVVQFAAAAWAVFLAGGLAAIDTGFGRVDTGIAIGSALAMLGIVWLLNLYNFLDGTDGYAGTQAVCAALAGGTLFWIGGAAGVATLCLTIAAAAAGFLFWNWPPARVFMGDVGSCFLGYTFGVLALFGEKSGEVPAHVWLILLGAFVWDATFTLLRRLLAGERWHDAHRSHAYQRLHQLGLGHRQIALWLLAVNVALLWPLAYAAALWNNSRPWALVISIVVLAIAWSLVQFGSARLQSHNSA